MSKTRRSREERAKDLPRLGMNNRPWEFVAVANDRRGPRTRYLRIDDGATYTCHARGGPWVVGSPHDGSTPYMVVLGRKDGSCDILWRDGIDYAAKAGKPAVKTKPEVISKPAEVNDGDHD